MSTDPTLQGRSSLFFIFVCVLPLINTDLLSLAILADVLAVVFSWKSYTFLVGKMWFFFLCTEVQQYCSDGHLGT